jgi:hypothetical protein
VTFKALVISPETIAAVIFAVISFNSAICDTTASEELATVDEGEISKSAITDPCLT